MEKYVELLNDKCGFSSDSIDRIVDSYKSNVNLVEKTFFLLILLHTDSSVIKELENNGLIDILESWYNEAFEDRDIYFLLNMLKVFNNIPATSIFNEKLQDLNSLDNADLTKSAQELLLKWNNIKNSEQKKNLQKENEKSIRYKYIPKSQGSELRTAGIEVDYSNELVPEVIVRKPKAVKRKSEIQIKQADPIEILPPIKKNKGKKKVTWAEKLSKIYIIDRYEWRSEFLAGQLSTGNGKDLHPSKQNNTALNINPSPVIRPTPSTSQNMLPINTDTFTSHNQRSTISPSTFKRSPTSNNQISPILNNPKVPNLTNEKPQSSTNQISPILTNETPQSSSIQRSPILTNQKSQMTNSKPYDKECSESNKIKDNNTSNTNNKLKVSDIKIIDVKTCKSSLLQEETNKSNSFKTQETIKNKEIVQDISKSKENTKEIINPIVNKEYMKTSKSISDSTTSNICDPESPDTEFQSFHTGVSSTTLKSQKSNSVMTDNDEIESNIPQNNAIEKISQILIDVLHKEIKSQKECYESEMDQIKVALQNNQSTLFGITKSNTIIEKLANYN